MNIMEAVRNRDELIRMNDDLFIIRSRERGMIFYREPLTRSFTGRVHPAVAVRWLLLPYLTVKLDDGMEVLLNRNYHPIWWREPGYPAARVPTWLWLDWERQRYHYHDRMPEQQCVDAGRRVCADWGIPLPDRLTSLIAPARLVGPVLPGQPDEAGAIQ